MAVDKESLLKKRLAETTVDIPGVGEVRVRGLSRAEVFMVQEVKGHVATEQKLLHLGMVDPELTESEARQWQDASPAGELEPITDAIRDLSGLGEDAPKEAMTTFRDGPDDGVRVLPGTEAVDDGGTTA